VDSVAAAIGETSIPQLATAVDNSSLKIDGNSSEEWFCALHIKGIPPTDQASHAVQIQHYTVRVVKDDEVIQLTGRSYPDDTRSVSRQRDNPFLQPQMMTQQSQTLAFGEDSPMDSTPNSMNSLTEARTPL
jgi:UDP-3-O-acyl-N-acetylglucosamine deacetylase